MYTAYTMWGTDFVSALCDLHPDQKSKHLRLVRQWGTDSWPLPVFCWVLGKGFNLSDPPRSQLEQEWVSLSLGFHWLLAIYEFKSEMNLQNMGGMQSREWTRSILCELTHTFKNENSQSVLKTTESITYFSDSSTDIFMCPRMAHKVCYTISPSELPLLVTLSLFLIQ